ncbi:MAG: DUF4347 domain-containing protein [Cyanobacteria bacterium J06639_14]
MSATNNTSSFDGDQGIIFVDSGISDYQALIGGLQPGSQVHLLNSEEDGIDQISQVLSQYSDLDSVHIFSHGDAGSLQLGNATLNQSTLGGYGAALQDWSSALAEDADLLFYGCNLGASPDGLLFMGEVATLTGADVAASDDLTGNAAQGADWDLEVETGAIESATLASTAFQGTLVAEGSFTGGALTVVDEDGEDNVLEFSLVNGDSLQVTDNGTVVETALIANITSINLLAGEGDDTVTFSSGFDQFANAVAFDINLGSGDDQFTVDTVVDTEGGLFKVNPTLADQDPAVFRVTTLDINGITLDLPSFDYGDTINFYNDISTNGGNLFVTGETITVGEVDAAGNVINAVVLDAGTDGDLTLNAARLDVTEVDNAPPDVTADGEILGTDLKETAITIDKESEVIGKNIILKAQSEDLSFLDLLAADQSSTTLNNVLLGPLNDQVQSFDDIPLKILLKESKATVNINADAQITGAAGVTIDATATSISSGGASNNPFTGTDAIPVALGYAEATANATVLLEGGVDVTAGEAVVISSDGNATADIASSIDQEKGDIVLALGLSFTDVTSTTTVAEGVTIESGKTANILATGSTETNASGESGTDQNKAVGLGFGLGYSKANITTDVKGSVTANQIPGSVVKIEFDPTEADVIDFDPTLPAGFSGSTIKVGKNALATGDQINYSNRRGDSIGTTNVLNGLTDDTDYYVILHPTDPEKILLASSEIKALRGEGIDFGTDASGFPGVLNSKEFDPNGTFDGEAIIDEDKDTITLGNEFFPDGAGGSLVESTFELGQAVKYDAGGGEPIGGLVDGGTYYIAASTNENNLEGDNRFVDRQIFGLSETENEARAGIGIDIDLDDTTGSNHSFSALHVIDSGLATGIGIIADLESNQDVTGSTSIDSSTTLELDLTFGIPNKIGNFWNSILGKLTAKLPKIPFDFSTSLDLAGGVALTDVDNTVQALVGSNAVLQSREDLEITATITDELQLNAESDIDADDPAMGGSPNTGALSGAVIVGEFDNTARAIVSENAQLDAVRANRVISDVSYPFLTRPDEFIPTTSGEFIDLLKTEGLNSVGQFFDGTLGVQDNLNTWARSTAQAEELSVAGAVNFLDFNNTSEATVSSGAQINQDGDFLFFINNPDEEDTPSNWTANETYTNVTPNNTSGAGTGMAVSIFVDEDGAPTVQLESNGTGYAAGDTVTFADPDGGGSNITITLTEEQVLSVEATNYMQTLNLAGVFDFTFPSFEGGKIEIDFDVSPVGSSGGKGGVGGAAFLMFLDNTTHAIVEEDVAINTGSSGGFNMKAEEAILNFNFTQAGAQSGMFAVGGSFSLVDQESDTLAQLQGGVDVTGRNVYVYGGNLGTHISLTGGIGRGNTVGVGAAASVHTLDRDVNAVIGNLDPAVDANGTTPATDTTINVTEGVDILADADGALWAFSAAGALSTMSADNSSQTNNFGLGISGDVGINTVTDDVNGYIHDAGSITSGSVGLEALSDIDIRAFSGAAAFITSTGTSVGIAGSYSQNTTTGNTRAYIRGKDANAAGTTQKLSLNTGNMSIKAERKGDLLTGSISGSATVGSDTSISLAGNVAINDIDNTTEGFIIGVGDTSTDPNTNETIFSTTAANVTIDVDDESRIRAYGGALAAALGDQAGAFGVAFASNEIISNTQAYLDETAIQATGDIDVDAKANLDIRALTVSAAGAGSFGGNVAIAGAGAIADNTLSSNVSATISNGSLIVGAAALKLAATDESKIIADSGGFALALAADANVAASVGISVALNDIASNIESVIDDSDVTLGGALTQTAKSTATIDALTIAGSFAGAFDGDAAGGIAGAGAIAENTIDGNDDNITDGSITAHIANGATVTASSISLTATDDSTIKSDTAGAAIALSAAGTLAGSLAIGGGFADNTINRTVSASIEGTETKAEATDTNISLVAQNNVDIEAFALGIAGAVAGGGQFAGAVSLGVAQGTNDITTTTDAYIQSNADVDAAGAVSLLATDEDSLIDATNGSLAVSFSGGTFAGSIAVAASLADNTINSNVRAYIGAADVTNDTTSVTAGSIAVDALSKSTIDSLSVAAALAGAIGLGGSLSGAGAESTNTITKTIEAGIQGGANVNVTATVGSVALTAEDTSSVGSEVSSFAGSAGLVAGSVGVSIADNSIDNTVQAYIDGAAVAATDSVDVDASSVTANTATAFAGAVAAGIGASISGTTAIADITTDVAAYIGSGSTVTADSDGIAAPNADPATSSITVKAASDNTSQAIVDSTSAGLVGVGNTIALATSNGTTSAYAGPADGSSSTGTTTLTGGGLIIEADSTNGALADVEAATGGLVAGQINFANVESSPTTQAYIGASVTVNVTGDVTVNAVGDAEADVDAQGSSDGAISVGASVVKSTVKPTVESYVDSGSSITATGDVTIEAQSGSVQDDDTLPGAFTPLADTDGEEGVNDDTDAITLLENHNLNTGDTVVYNSFGNTAIGGLEETIDVEAVDEDGNTIIEQELREYQVIEVDDNTIKLGVEFDANADVDALTDTITFDTPHNLQDGDQVVYSFGFGTDIFADIDQASNQENTFFVKVIDDSTIKLVETEADLTPAVVTFSAADDISNDTINAANTFSNGDAVTYRAPEATEFSVDVVDVTPTTDSDGNTTFVANAGADTIFIPDAANLFDVDDEVVYRVEGGSALGELTNGTTYKILSINGDVIELAATNGNSALDLDPANVEATATHSLRLTTDEPINIDDGDPDNRLVDGQTYYVISADANSFQLVANQGDTVADVIQLDVTDLGSSNHQFSVEGLDLVGTAIGTQELRIDLDTSNLNTSNSNQIHLFQGSGGVSLDLVNPALGDGKSTANTTGSSGSIIGTVNANVSNVEANYTVSTRIDGAINAGGNVAILADSISNLAALGANGSGGAIALGVAEVGIDVTQNTTTTINTDITAGGDVNVAANTSEEIDAITDVEALGLGVAGTANFLTESNTNTIESVITNVTGLTVDITPSVTDVEANTNVVVSRGSEIIADGDLSILADTAANLASRGEVEASGGGAGAEANSTINGAYDTQVNVERSTDLTGNTVAIKSQVSELGVDANAKTKATALGVFSRANADVNITSNVATNISELTEARQATINGNQGVDIQALHLDADDPTTTDVIEGIQTDANARGELLALGGSVNADADNVTQLTALVTSGFATVNAGPRIEGGPLTPVDEVENNPDGKVDDLALYVEASNPEEDDFANADASRKVTALIPFGSSSEDDGGSSADGNIEWSATVGKSDSSVEERILEIDENGEIVTAQGISVNGGQTSGSVIGDISIDDIGGPSGDIVFKADDAVSRLSDPAFGTVTPLFIFGQSNTSDITINNASDQDLILNDVFGAGNTQPTVVIDDAGEADPLDFQFRINSGDVSDIAPIAITVNNTGTSDIFVNGQIQNPIGSTTITNEDGSILASNAQNFIETNTLDLDASGNIGDNDTSRINAQLVQTEDSATGLDADATDGNIYLNLQGLLRDSTVTDFTINLENITAGGDIDLTLENSLLQTTIDGSVGSVDVEVIEDDPTDPLSGEYFEFFYPDTGSQSTTIDASVFASGGTDIDTTYQLGTLTAAPGLTAGDDITITATETDTDLTNVSGFIDTDSDQDGTGSLSINVDGDVNLTEVSGNLTVEEVISTAGDVTLSLPDTAAEGEDLFMDGGTISANGDVNLFVGDNFVASNDSTISAGGDVVIEVDSGNADADVNGGIAFDGSITVGDPLTGTIDVSGNTDDDILFFADTTTNVGMTISGGAGADRIVTGNNDDTVFGGAGADEIGVGNGNNTINAGADNDLVYSLDNTITGTNTVNLGTGENIGWLQSGNNSITARDANGDLTDEDNNVGIGSGNDTVTLGDGNNFVYSVEGTLRDGGTNTVTVGDGNNILWFESGNNTVVAGDGDNNIGLGTGNDDVTTGTGDDFAYSVNGGGGTDILRLSDGENTVFVENGDSTITTGNDADEINLGSGTDAVESGGGNDIIFQITVANAGSKTVNAGTGSDFVQVGLGNDVIDLGTNDSFDVAVGQSGQQTFVLNSGNGFSEVQQFVRGEDLLSLGGGLTFGDLTITDDGTDTQILLNGELLAVLIDVIGIDVTDFA